MQTGRRPTQPSLRDTASETSQEESAQDDTQPKDFDTLAEEITDRVWALWRKELVRDRERLGRKPRR